MTYWIKRIILKDGRLVTERDLDAREYTFEGPAPVVGDIVRIKHAGRSFDAEVIWGNWEQTAAKRHPLEIVPLRVKEL
jgi:hypothetical protein